MDEKPFIPPPPNGLRKEEKVELPKRPDFSSPREEPVIEPVQTENDMTGDDLNQDFADNKKEKKTKDRVKKEKPKKEQKESKGGSFINYIGFGLSIIVAAACIVLLFIKLW